MDIKGWGKAYVQKTDEAGIQYRKASNPWLPLYLGNNKTWILAKDQLLLQLHILAFSPPPLNILGGGEVAFLWMTSFVGWRCTLMAAPRRQLAVFVWNPVACVTQSIRKSYTGSKSTPLFRSRSWCVPPHIWQTTYDIHLGLARTM